jgi:hypothetical protein
MDHDEEWLFKDFPAVVPIAASAFAFAFVVGYFWRSIFLGFHFSVCQSMLCLHFGRFQLRLLHQSLS